MRTLSNYTKVLLGTVDNEKIYLSPPSWDCGRYWGFGYLGNDNCHYHVGGLTKIEKYNTDKKVFEYEFVNLYEGLKKHFGGSFIVRREKDIWTLAELFKTFYSLREACEILGRGGSHLTANPCANLIINKIEVERINNEVLPQIFEEIYKIIYRNQDSDKVFKKLVSLNVEGNTTKVIEYMKENQIHTDDLKNINGLTSGDISNIHTYYWKDFHANKS